MDDYLRIQNNGYDRTSMALSERVNYAGKLFNLTCINSGQIDADKENIGTIGWTYQSEMGNVGAKGTGGGTIHNGWRQMAGEADLGLFGAIRILSSDVVTEDPVFGLFGYGCIVTNSDGVYHIIPKDGLFTRLNFIEDKFYIELERDQYKEATISNDKKNITLSMVNIEGTKHNTSVQLTGLPVGVYTMSIKDKVVNVFNVADSSRKVTTSIPLAEGDSPIVTIKLLE